MAKRHVYQKAMHGYSDFVYVDLLPQVKRARQFNVNVIVALLFMIVLTYILIFVPYTNYIVEYEELKAENQDLTHQLKLTNEEYAGYEIENDVIIFEDHINQISSLKVDLKDVMLDIEQDISNNDSDWVTFYYSADQQIINVIVQTSDYVNYSLIKSDLLSRGWVEYANYEQYKLLGDGHTYESTYTIGVDTSVK